MTTTPSTIILPVTIGLIIVLTAQVIIRFFLDPLKEFKLMRLQVAFKLDFYANYWANPGVGETDKLAGASFSLREAAMHLKTQPYAIPLYSSVARLLGYPSKQDLSKASRLLTQLSNSIFKGDPFKNSESVDEILGLLRLPTRDE